MEAPITLATQQQNVPTSTVPQPRQEDCQAALEVVLGAMQKLLDDEQSNAFQLGKYVNKILDEGLAVDSGYRSPKSCFIQKLKGIDERNVASLYTYARVAKSFSEADAREFGIFKLNSLMTYQMQVHNQILRGDPGDYEIALLQEDGTISMKKFRDCSVSELRDDLKRRKQLKHPTPEQTASVAIAPKPTRSQAPVASVPATGKGLSPVVRRSGKLIGLGVVVTTVGEFLRATMVGPWIAWLGSAIILAGVGMLALEWVKMHEEWMNALERALQPVLRGFEGLQSMTWNFRALRPPKFYSPKPPAVFAATSSQVSEESPSARTKAAA